MQPPKPPEPASIQTGNKTAQIFNNYPVVDELKIEYQAPEHVPPSPEEIHKQLIEANIEQPLPPKQEKYNIMDLFWLINPKLGRSETLNQGEIEFVTISFNVDFGNLRINFYSIPEGAIQNNIVFLHSLKLLISGTIYPSSCFRIMHGDSDGKFTCMEQLITKTGESWQSERTICRIEHYSEAFTIRLIMENPKTEDAYYYDFSGWHMDTFIHACRFTHENGFICRANNILRRQ